MSWMQHALTGALRHQSSSNFCRRAACASWAASAAPARQSAPSHSTATAAAAMPRMAAAARSLHMNSSSFSSMPFAARFSAAPSFAASPLTSAVSTGGSRGGAGVAAAGSSTGTGVESVGEDDEETLEPRSKRHKKPPDDTAVHAASTQSTEAEEDTIEGTSPDDGEQILFLSRNQRLQQPLSREAAARLHYLIQVRESQSGLPRVRVGKEGLRKAFLATVGDYLQAHGAVKVHVPKTCGVEPGFVAFCLESSQDCVVLGIKGNTLTVYRDTSLPRPPSTYADTDLAFSAANSPPPNRAAVAVHSHSHSTAHQQQVLQQLSQQVESGNQPLQPHDESMYPQHSAAHDASAFQQHSAAQHKAQDVEEVALLRQQQNMGGQRSGMQQDKGDAELGAAGRGESEEEWLEPMPAFKQLDLEEDEREGEEVSLRAMAERSEATTWAQGGHGRGGGVSSQGGRSSSRDIKKGSGKVSGQEGGPAKRLKLRLGRVMV